jgi:hypothetical protein
MRYATLLLTAILLLAAAPGPVHPQQTLRCLQALADPQVAAPAADTPWRELRPSRQITTAQSRSAPQSIALLGAVGSGPATGQTIAVPAATSELYGALYVRFGPDLGPAAAARVTLYAGNSTDPIAAVFSVDLPRAGNPTNVWLRFDWELTDPVGVERLRAAGSTTVALELADTPGGTVWIDDITANTCEPTASLSGRVTLVDAPAGDLSGATLLLARIDAAGTQVLATVRSDATGAYSFSGVPALAEGATYQIWYTNTPAGPALPAGRIGALAGPVITRLVDGERRTGLDLAIDDVRLDAPAPNAVVVATNAAPVTLRWSGRVVAGERHQVCLYDPLRIDPETGASPELCGPLRNPATEALSFDLSPASFAAAPALGFAYGRTYRWYVRVVGPATPAGQPQRTGRSFFERSITLLERPAPEPPASPAAPDPGPPDAVSAGAEWTLLVYAALDNALSDPARTPGPDRVDRRVEALRTLAARYPNVRVVTLLDRYGATGVEWCYLPPNAAPDCRTRPEANSADPATLRGFVEQGLQRYPARRAALALLGPGHAVGGFGADESSPNAPVIAPGALNEALRAATATAGRRLDLIVAQAPLMAEIDLAADLAPAVDYLVASPDLLWRVDLFPHLLPLLSGAQTNAPPATATGLVEAYATAVNRAARGRAFTLVALDLRRAENTFAAREGLADALRNALSVDEATTRTILEAARLGAQPYDASANGRLRALERAPGTPTPADEDAFVDLSDFALRLAEEPRAPVPVREAAAAVRDTLGPAAGFVLAVRAQTGIGVAGDRETFIRVGGPALFFPGAARLGDQPAQSALWLHESASAASAWASFLRELRAGSLPGSGSAGVLEVAPGRPGLALPVSNPIGGTELYLPVVRR